MIQAITVGAYRCMFRSETAFAQHDWKIPHCEPHFVLYQAAARSWYDVSPARRKMVADRHPSFWIVVVKALGSGFIFAQKEDFVAWAQAEELAGCDEPSIVAVGRTPGRGGHPDEDELTRRFGEMLRAIGLRIPDQPAVLAHFAVVTAKACQSKSIAPRTAARILSEINEALRDLPRGAIALECLSHFDLLTRGMRPDTFAMFENESEFDAAVMDAFSDVVRDIGPMVVTSDNPSDWPSNWS